MNLPNIGLWDGDVSGLNTFNQANFTQIQEFVNNLDTLAETNPMLDHYNLNLNLELLDDLNREVRNQFMTNAKQISSLLPQIIDNVLTVGGVLNYTFWYPTVPEILVFDKTIINNYWQAIINDIKLLAPVLTKL